MRTGIDMVEIRRIASLMKNERFLNRFFSKEEYELFKERGFAPQTVAANFAAKEAFSKALGTGISGFSLNEVSVLRKSSGEPYFMFLGNALKLAEESGLSFCLSITHTEELASAFVIAYR